MDILRIAAFSTEGQGGNPAGAVLQDSLPSVEVMQQVAADVGYSETVFAAPFKDGFRARYFAPTAEVPFCGHATIALGAALGAAHGAGPYPLYLNEAAISVRATKTAEGWTSELTSPTTKYQVADPALVREAFALFGWGKDDLAAGRDMIAANGGASHLLIPLGSRDLLRHMAYDFEEGARVMQKHQLVTINLYFEDESGVIHSRNPFAGHGVYEDPATGAAAAALGGYLRDAHGKNTAFTVHQGFDMGVPSTLFVQPLAGEGAAVKISGATRLIGV